MTKPHPETRLERKKRKTRQLLIDATLELIVEKGIDHFTVQDVSESADVALATLYNYFKSKEELILEATKLFLSQLADDISSQRGDLPDPALGIIYGLSSVIYALTFQDRVAWLRQRPLFLSTALYEVAYPYIIKDLKAGIETKRLAVNNPELIWRMISCNIVGIILNVSLEQTPKEEINEAVVNIMKMVGLREEETLRLIKQLPSEIRAG